VRCRLPHALCLCAEVPAVSTSTALLLLLHRDEERKPTNTGQLAARCLTNSRVVVTGDLQRPLPSPLLPADHRVLLLFPADDAVDLRTILDDGDPRPRTLVVPDGTWRQASKARQRIEGLQQATCVTLPPGPPTSYQLRAEPKESGLATLEAIARAFAVLEAERGSEVEAALLRVFRLQVQRTLWMRGALRDDEVEGGIPAAAHAEHLRG
jgi:DTW domain-containing protein YfiP